MRAKLLLTILTATSILLAGCVSPDLPLDATDTLVERGDGRAPQAVIAIIDTGINPYHVDFRDNSTLALAHPSTYLPGYPADAVAVNLTLDAESLDAALEADDAVWRSLSPHTLYWFPGTKIVAGYSTEEGAFPIFSTGHGTMTASRAAGNAYSLCPECRIASVQGFNSESVTWTSEQSWIDAQSNSWSPLVVFQQADAAQSPGLAQAFEAAAGRHAVFGSAGNGAMGKGGVLGHPSFTRSTSGPRGVVSVGGHDNGNVALWPGSFPHIVADACSNWAAVGNTLTDYSASAGGGTSSASPYAAGAAARMVLEARRILSDDSIEGVVNATFARAAATTMTTSDGPLADGDFTIEELKRVLFTTATPRPVKTAHDGDMCSPASPYNTYPVAWEDIPEDVPTYYFIGYGQISVDSLDLALEVLRGDTPMPSRPVADEWNARADTIREAYRELPV